MYFGIDIGTSSVKIVAADDAQRVVAKASADIPISHPQPSHSEQDPQNWWRATNEAMLAIDSHVRRNARAIGLSGQMHGAVLLGKENKALRPAILWNDGRSAAECEILEAPEYRLREITGNRAMPGFTAPKLIWVNRHEPDVFAQIRKVLLPKDYVRLLMSGDYASDKSDSAGTLWLDMAHRRWSKHLLEACELDEKQMPSLFEGSEFTGTLRKKVAADWGMEQVPIVAGGGDNAAGAIGSGVVNPGEGFISLGTSGVIFAADDGFRPNPEGGVHTFCHALPGRWHQMSVMLSAASAIDWTSRLVGYSDPAAFYSDIAVRGKLSESELFLPYIAGERTPHNDPAAKGVFFGLTPRTDPIALGQAAMEGVTFGLADCFDALLAAGISIDSCSIIGGGARSEYWGSLISSALDIPLIYREDCDVGPSYGAARLARIAHSGEEPASVCSPPPVRKVIEPAPEIRDHLARRRPKFQHLYQQVRPILQE